MEPGCGSIPGKDRPPGRARSGPIRDERGAVTEIVAAGMVVFLAIAALALDYGRFWVYSTQLQGAADAAALAGASKVYVTQGVDGNGTVYSSATSLNEYEAHQEALNALDQNLTRILQGQDLTVLDKQVLVPGLTVTVRVTVRGRWHLLPFTSIGPATISRMATAEYIP